MTWETIPLRGGSVSASWRFPGGKGARRQLCLTISSGLCDAVGLAPGKRVVVQRDRVIGKLRLAVVAEKVTGARCPRWKKSAVADVAVLWVPLPDVVLRENRPAVSVQHEIAADGALVIRLPSWALPAGGFVKVEPRAA